MNDKTAKKDGNDSRLLHLVMQGKGGAGKSFVSSLICQAYQSQGKPFMALDLDPVNHTLAAIKPLNADVWNILKNSDNPTIDPTRFDELVTKLLESESDIVIDTGSTSFLPFNNYLIQQEITSLLAGNGVTTKIHCVIRGGSSLTDCIGGLDQLCEHHDPATEIYAWLNEVEGAIMANGKQFEEMKVYERRKDRISGVIKIPEQTNELYQIDMTTMLQRAQTFDQAISDPNTNIVSKKRLEQLRNYYFDAIKVHF